MYHLWATFEVASLFGDPRERRGDVAIVPTFGLPLILSTCLGTPENAPVM